MTAPAPQSQPEAAPVRQHAPLPWRLAGKGTIRGAGNNSWVCSMNWRDRAGNSALLLEAVNSHATLQARVEAQAAALLIAQDVVWFDWSNNDADAVHAIAQLRLALSALSLERSGGAT